MAIETIIRIFGEIVDFVATFLGVKFGMYITFCNMRVLVIGKWVRGKQMIKF